MKTLVKKLLSISDNIRYVAIYKDGELTSSVKSGLLSASDTESDKYEELIVNPAVLTLVRQRGNIDCGGCQFFLVRYGNFYQLVVPYGGGHVSVCIEQTAQPLNYVESIRELLTHEI